MKKAIIITGLMFIAISNLSAQTQQTPPRPTPPPGQQQMHQPMTSEQRAQMMTDKLTKLLNLSDKQQKQVYAVNLDETKKMQASMEKHERPDMSSIMQDRDSKFKSILTPDQYEKYKGLMANHAQRTPPPPSPATQH